MGRSLDSTLPESFYHYSALILLAFDLIALVFILIAELVIRPRYASNSHLTHPPSSNHASSTSPTSAGFDLDNSTTNNTSTLKCPPQKACHSVLLHTKLRSMSSVFYIAFGLISVVIPTFAIVWKRDFTLTIYLTVLIGLIFMITLTAELLHFGGKGMWLPHAEDVLYKPEKKILEAVRRERKGEFTLPACQWHRARTTYHHSTTPAAVNVSEASLNAENAAGGVNIHNYNGIKREPSASTTVNEAATARPSGDTLAVAESGGVGVVVRERQAGKFRKAVRRMIFEELYFVPYLLLAVPFLAILTVRYGNV